LDHLNDLKMSRRILQSAVSPERGKRLLTALFQYLTPDYPALLPTFPTFSAFAFLLFGRRHNPESDNQRVKQLDRAILSDVNLHNFIRRVIAVVIGTPLASLAVWRLSARLWR
jgi:hypothetical protein